MTANFDEYLVFYPDGDDLKMYYGLWRGIALNEQDAIEKVVEYGADPSGTFLIAKPEHVRALVVDERRTPEIQHETSIPDRVQS